jgi:hypothetical protein
MKNRYPATFLEKRGILSDEKADDAMIIPAITHFPSALFSAIAAIFLLLKVFWASRWPV